MKLEDLKLPSHDEIFVIWDSAPSVDIALAGISYQVAKSVCDQMREHYEADKQPAPEWRLPDPPPGQQWHRTDWKQDMLVDAEGNQYRPLLDGEKEQPEDEFFGSASRKWILVDDLGDRAGPISMHARTRRPLPATPAQPEPVEYVPLEPRDVQPGSAVRKIGSDGWLIVDGVFADGPRFSHWDTNWGYLAAHYEILRPGSTTWEPCKKPKA